MCGYFSLSSLSSVALEIESKKVACFDVFRLGSYLCRSAIVDRRRRGSLAGKFLAQRILSPDDGRWMMLMLAAAEVCLGLRTEVCSSERKL